MQLVASLLSEVSMCWVMHMTPTDNLSMNCCISFIVNQDAEIGFNHDLVVNFQEQRVLLV